MSSFHVPRSVSEGDEAMNKAHHVTRSVSFEVTHFSREAAAAHSRGRQPTERKVEIMLSREAATATGLAAAASRLTIEFADSTAGLRPQLHAPVASRLRCVTSKPMLRVTCALLLLAVAGVALAQRSPFMRREFRPEMVDRGGVPEWKNDERFKADVFTFVRVRYSSHGGGRGGNWATDYPDSDLNFSYRLHELTALEVDPNGKILELTDDALLDYPWVYLIEPGRMSLTEAEVVGLRKYLLNGGFMMVDDFWGEYEWDNFYHEIKRVFPDREPVELPLEHEIFHCVYDLKKKPQVPSIHSWMATGRTDDNRPDAAEVHYRALFDDKGRMMAIICHNTDLGDGWEREGESVEYFKEFAEKWSYPIGINIVTYAMTH